MEFASKSEANMHEIQTCIVTELIAFCAQHHDTMGFSLALGVQLRELLWLHAYHWFQLLLFLRRTQSTNSCSWPWPLHTTWDHNWWCNWWSIWQDSKMAWSWHEQEWWTSPRGTCSRGWCRINKIFSLLSIILFICLFIYFLIVLMFARVHKTHEYHISVFELSPKSLTCFCSDSNETA